MPHRMRVVLIVASFALGAVAPAASLTLSDAGHAYADVLVAADAPPPVRHAADELTSFLRQVTGAPFVQVAKLGTRPCIAVGPTAARTLDPAFTTVGLGREGTVVRAIDGRHLVLAGGPPRGTLYAVYSFLEDYVGCRWWTPQACDIPRRPRLTVPARLARRHVPPLEYRYPFWSVAFDADWLARNRANGHWRRHDGSPPEEELVQRFGGYMSHGGVHTFYRLIPPEGYFADHPEWFSEIDNKRRWQHAQLCLSNTAMRAELIRNLKQVIRRQPEPPIHSVSQNDWHGYCTCAACRALAERYGGQSGLMLWFVNQVAAAVAAEFPNHTISTLAYQYTRQPPRGIRPAPNVVVQLCSIECSFSVPLTHARNAAFRDDIVGWSGVADRLYIWDYTTDFRHYLMPHPNLRVLGPNLRFFVDHHVRGVFEQGAYTSLGAEFAELRAWVLAKLLWDPRQDDRALIRTFCEGYYGAAAPHLLALIDGLHDAAAAAEEAARCLPSYTYEFPYLSLPVLTGSWQHLQTAWQAVADDPPRRTRVEQAQLWILYPFLWRWRALRAEADRTKTPWPLDPDIHRVAARVRALAEAHGVTRINEWDDGFGLLDRCLARATQ